MNPVPPCPQPTTTSSASSSSSPRDARRARSTRTGATWPRSAPSGTGPSPTPPSMSSSAGWPRCALPDSPRPRSRVRTSAARAYFRHLGLVGARDDNPAAALVLPKRPRRLPRALSPGETERLIDAATGSSPRTLRDRALVELLYGAGLRVSEAVGLEKGAVDLDASHRPGARQGREGTSRPARPTGGGSRPALPRARPAAPRPPVPARALPERPRRAADASRRVPHPAKARGESGSRAHARPPPPTAPLVRDAPPRGRRRPPQRPGDARPRRSRHDRALHAHLGPPETRGLLQRSPSRAEEDLAFRQAAS